MGAKFPRKIALPTFLVRKNGGGPCISPKQKSHRSIRSFMMSTVKLTTISTKTTSRVEAVKFLRKFQKEILQVDVKESTKFISEFAEEYYKYVLASKSNKYYKSIKLSFNHLLKYTGDVPLDTLNIRILEQFITNSFSRAQSATLLYYRTLKAAFSKAVDWEYLYENPLKK
ncbi:MAG: phage integrase SAM-like domain-containing protein [Ignavibacteriales bacterium]|nr:phage integrase SAM-like domain-containing protein [Ignavibacteriales bacterium]